MLSEEKIPPSPFTKGENTIPISLWERVEFTNSGYGYTAIIFIIGAYAAPNPAPDILSFCCDAKHIAARGHKHTLCVCVPV